MGTEPHTGNCEGDTDYKRLEEPSELTHPPTKEEELIQKENNAKKMQNEETKKPLRQSPNELCKERVKAVRNLLPKNAREIIYKKYPQYNNAEGVKLIDNVLHGASSDVFLTQVLEEIAAEQLKEEIPFKDGEQEKKVA